MKILVAGVGNVLLYDDGFGVEVARRLEQMSLPDGVDLIETGIGGMALVQELCLGYDACIIVDAADRGRPPGTVMLIEPDVLDVRSMPVAQRHDLLADMHLATPERSMMVARAMGVLPERTFLVGCQPTDVERLEIGLSAAVAAAVDVGVDEVLRCIQSLRDRVAP